MHKFLILVFLISFMKLSTGLDKRHCVCKSPAGRRVIGGRFSLPNQYPWMISLAEKEQYPEDERHLIPDDIKIGAHECGGVIINERFILTAAHCSNEEGKVNYSVGYGSNDLIKIYDFGRNIVKKVYIHPGYNKSIHARHDLAILELKDKIKFSNSILPACLESNVYKNYGSNIVIAGFGATKKTVFDDDKNKVEEPIVPSRFLKEADYMDVSRKIGTKCEKDKKIVCMDNINEGDSACHGDSGGPAMYRTANSKTVVLGITSGSDYEIRDGNRRIMCNGYVYYTRVGYYLNWIKSIVGENHC